MTLEIARLLRTLGTDQPDIDQAAQELLAMSDGVTLGVLIGSLTPDQARSTLRSAVDRLLSHSSSPET
ncbi:MAG: TetR family transcriptional regulator C-terminal domain-containing protein [Propionibacteriaceae bacterium]|nr:TetR family transcriptional regulator C-terminal domain-containing protein [Propionibacteriaceae bacterium]